MVSRNKRDLRLLVARRALWKGTGNLSQNSLQLIDVFLREGLSRCLHLGCKPLNCLVFQRVDPTLHLHQGLFAIFQESCNSKSSHGTPVMEVARSFSVGVAMSSLSWVGEGSMLSLQVAPFLMVLTCESGCSLGYITGIMAHTD